MLPSLLSHIHEYLTILLVSFSYSNMRFISATIRIHILPSLSVTTYSFDGSVGGSVGPVVCATAAADERERGGSINFMQVVSQANYL